MGARTEDTIAVVIPVRNERAYIGVAVTSVLEQTRPPFEIVVVRFQLITA